MQLLRCLPVSHPQVGGRPQLHIEDLGRGCGRAGTFFALIKSSSSTFSGLCSPSAVSRGLRVMDTGTAHLAVSSKGSRAGYWIMLARGVMCGWAPCQNSTGRLPLGSTLPPLPVLESLWWSLGRLITSSQLEIKQSQRCK